jgi:hypothetical protein
MTDPNTTELGAHPGAASEPSLVSPQEHSLLQREVSADGMIRVNAGDSVGINLGMGYVEDGREKMPVSQAAETVSTTRDLFVMPGEGGLGTPDGTPDPNAASAMDGETAVRKAAKATTAKKTSDGA